MAVKMDFFSSLPEEIIHHIFSYLPDDKDLVRTSILSKPLRSSSCSFSALILNFIRKDVTNYEVNALLNAACHAVEKREKDSQLRRFSLRFKASPKHRKLIDKLVHYALNNCIGKVDLDAASSDIYIHRHPFSCPTSSVKSFKVLKLQGFRIDIETLLLLLSCPLLEDLDIDNCKLPETVNACSPKLKTFTLGPKIVSMSTIAVQCPSLKVFRSLTPIRLVAIDSSCTSITDLSLFDVRNTRGWIEHISKLSNLEKLRLVDFKASHAKLSNPLLKTVEFGGGLDGTINFEIDAPNLESLIIKNCGSCEVGHCPKLKKLELDNVHINDAWMKTRISEWRALQNLSLQKCRGLRNLNIWSSTLENLGVQYCPDLIGFNVSSGSLRSAEIFQYNEAVMFMIHAPKLEALETRNHHESGGGAYASACQNSLRNLNLEKQCVNARWLRHQTGNLPLLESLILLPENGHFSSSSYINIQALRLASCRVIKTLQLDMASNVDHCLERILLKLVSLRDLSLTSCEDMKILKISHEQLLNLKVTNCNALCIVEVVLPQLETFCLDDCKNLWKANINTPRLSSFKYRGPVCIASLKHSRSLHAELSLCQSSVHNISDDKFNTLWEFLRICNGCEILSLDYFEDLIFPSKVRVNMAPALSGLKHLELQELGKFSFAEATMEGLLWLCPGLEDFSFVTNDERKIIQFEYDESRFNGIKSYSDKVRESEVWRLYLKKIALKNFTVEQHNLLNNLFIKHCKMFTTKRRSHSRTSRGYVLHVI